VYTVPTPTPAPAPAVTPTPAPVPLATTLKSISTPVAAAFKTLKFSHVLGQGHSTITIPISQVGTYTVTINYRTSTKADYKSIAKGAIIVKTPGKTTYLPIKPNAYGKSTYAKIKKSKKSTINVQIVVTFETGGKTVSTTFTRKFQK
ncbi:MAG: hypothetical protein AAGC46_21190, partial [Solirubrobacteraceae bacterium]